MCISIKTSHKLINDYMSDLAMCIPINVYHIGGVQMWHVHTMYVIVPWKLKLHVVNFLAIKGENQIMLTQTFQLIIDVSNW
jgi:hypothetical protein